MCRLHDPYQIQNLVIFGTIVEYKFACIQSMCLMIALQGVLKSYAWGLK